MATLVDTSILGRLAGASDPKHLIADGAVAELHRRGESLHLTAQNLVEFMAVATRPLAVNGMGKTVAKADIDKFRRMFPLPDDTPAIFPAWLALVVGLGVMGKQAHDARLATCCHVHGVGTVLTFNVGLFTRFAAFGSGLRVIDPATV